MEGQQSQNPSSANEISSPLSALLSNPALLQGLGAMLKSGTAPPTEPTQSTSVQSDTGNSQSLAPALSIDPGLLSRLPQMMSVLSAIQKPLPTTPTGDREAEREALLCALKPFLSPARADAIDALLRLLRLSRAMGQFR